MQLIILGVKSFVVLMGSLLFITLAARYRQTRINAVLFLLIYAAIGTVNAIIGFLIAIVNIRIDIRV